MLKFTVLTILSLFFFFKLLLLELLLNLKCLKYWQSLRQFKEGPNEINSQKQWMKKAKIFSKHKMKKEKKNVVRKPRRKGASIKKMAGFRFQLICILMRYGSAYKMQGNLKCYFSLFCYIKFDSVFVFVFCCCLFCFVFFSSFFT